MIDLSGRVAIVTGGCSGIGRGTVNVLRRAGARVACVDVQDDKGQALAKELGEGVLYVHADVTSEDEVAAAFGRVVERFGGIDVLFNNAGSAEPLGSDPFDLGIFDGVQKLLVQSVVLGMKYAVPSMVERGGGSIVNTASIEGIVAEIMAAPYNTAKAGMINLSRTVAIEYGRKNIRSNCICPGVVDTPLAGMLLAIAPKSRAEVEAEHAIGRLIRPEEIANVALFLASDESSAVTGSAIVVDGGLISKSPISGFPPYGA